MFFFFFSSRRRHTRSLCDWSSDVCSSDLGDLRQRRAEIVDADALERPEAARRDISELVAETGQPERMAVLMEFLRVVFVNRNTGGLQRAACGRQSLPVALHFLVFPPI